MPSKKSASGKFVLRLPVELHGRLKEKSEQAGKSLNAVCSEILEQGLQIDGDKSLGLLAEPLKFLKKHFGSALLGVALFGSEARAEATEQSDIDLLVVLSSDVEIVRTLYQEWDRYRFKVDEREINPHFVHLSTPENAGGIWFETAIEGRILYDLDHILSTALMGLREYALAGKMQRQSAHGHPYWIRKVS
ncbi:nucleotidyltransferase domain-containing protein [Bdellovibrionota bacterium FG-2]